MADDKHHNLCYVIQWQGSSEFCKIGKTNNISNRFRSFLCAHHDNLKVLLIASEDIISEARLHEQFASARHCLEHFNYTPDLQAMIEAINFSTGFEPYLIERTLHKPTEKDYSLRQDLLNGIRVPPLRLSPKEREVVVLQSLGMTSKETAEALNLSESAVRSHRQGYYSKCFSPNAFSAISKLWIHGVLTPEEFLLK